MLQKTFFGFGSLAILCILLFMFQYKKIVISHTDDDKISRTDIQQDIVMTASISHNNKKKRFPDAIIIGVKKGGTRALLDMLSSHPVIKGCKGEPQFFSRQFKRGLKWYIHQMPLTAEDELTMEKSPSYFTDELAPQRIHDITSGKIKLILIVRNPITRTISDFVHLSSNGMKFGSFKENIVFHDGTINVRTSEIYKSMYDIHYQRWLKWFKKEQIFVVNGDELITHPASPLSQIEEFLKVTHYFNKEMFHFNDTKGFYCWNPQKNITTDLKCLGSSKGRQHPIISQDVLDKVKVALRPHTERFCSIASVNFSWCDL